MGRSPLTIRPLSNNFCIFHPWASHVEQLDHFLKIFEFFAPQAGHLEQLDRFQKILVFFTNKQVA